MIRVINSDRNLAKIFLIPSLLLILIFNIYPIFYVIVISLQDRGLFDQTANFVAFKNYITIFKDSAFLNALKNSFIWTFSTTFFELVIGTIIALLLNRNFKGRGIARGLVLVPYVIPAIVSTLIWKYMFNDLVGLINYVLKILNISQNPITFLASPKLAMPVVILVNVWHYFPFVVISILAALQSIKADLFDAAQVDGASNFQIFRYIIIPTIAPVFIMVALLRTIFNFQKFDIIYMLTQGGPLNKTTTLPILIYNQAFIAYDISKASSYAIVIALILILMSSLYMKYFDNAERRVEE